MAAGLTSPWVTAEDEMETTIETTTGTATGTTIVTDITAITTDTARGK